jgi:hypothetical protein
MTIGSFFIGAIDGYKWLLVPILLVAINGYFIGSYSINNYYICHNPSLGLATKGRVCNGLQGCRLRRKPESHI